MSQNQNQGHDPLHEMAWIGVALLIIVLVVRYFFGDEVMEGYLQLRLVWIEAFELLFETATLHHARMAIETYDPQEWSFFDVVRMSNDLRWYLFAPLSTIFVVYAGWVIKKNPADRFKRRLTRKTLCESEVQLWPWIAPVLHLDLIKTSIETGRWAMSPTELAFCRKYGLLDDGRTLNRKRAERRFAMQLGELWDGPDRLKPYLRALFACFIAQACRDKAAARAGLRRLALSMATQKRDYGFVQELLDKYYNDPRVQDIVSKNAYVSTVMLTALERARTAGVLPSLFFLWLRPINRPVWYALNGLGRDTPFCENAGTHAHWLAEKVADHGIERPYVTKAVEALESELNRVKFD